MKKSFYIFFIITLLMPFLSIGQSSQTTNQHTNLNNMQPTKMQIEIWSDVFCPFCYIGKRNFETALDSLSNAQNIEIIWRSYQLSPDAKFEAGIDMHTSLANHLHTTPAQAKQMNENVTAMAKNSGLDYNLDHAVWANTYNAHRLIQYAKKQGLSNEAEERFFKAVFIEGKNIEDFATLVALATEIGLDKNAVTEILNSNQFAEEVKNDIIVGQQLGIRGVPTFVIDRKSAFSGALPPAQMLALLKNAYTDWAKDKPDFENTQGGICTPKGECK